MKLKIIQVRSAIGRKSDQKRTLKALGLRGPGHSVVKANSPELRGMVEKVKHLLRVEELKE